MKPEIESISRRPIILTKATCDILIKQKNSAALLGLYIFYCHTAIWQNTHQPWANVKYIAKKLKIGVHKVRELRKVLLTLGLIEDIQEKSSEGSFLKRYVKVNYFTVLTVLRSTANSNTICLGTNKHTVARKTRNELILEKTKKPFDERCIIKLLKVLKENKKVFRKVNKKQWTSQFKKFRDDSGFNKQRIRKVLTWYINHFGEEFIPKAYSSKTFCDKFIKIEESMERSIKNIREGKASPKCIKRIVK